jgi:hypothetical protein
VGGGALTLPLRPKQLFQRALTAEGMSRMDWGVLDTVASGRASPAGALPSFARLEAVLDDLAQRGWLTGGKDTPSLTDMGRSARRRLLAEVTVLRRRVTDGIGADEYVHAVAALARMVADAESAVDDGRQRLPDGHSGARDDRADPCLRAASPAGVSLIG